MYIINISFETFAVSPVCRKSRETKFYRRSQIKPETELICEVESNPPPTHFSWSVNTSSGLQHIPQVIIYFLNSIEIHQIKILQSIIIGTIFMVGHNINIKIFII